MVKKRGSERAVQQVIGREGETATLLSRRPLNFSGLGGGFAPRHLNRSPPAGSKTEISIGLTSLKLEFYLLSNLSLKISGFCWQTSCAIRRFPQSCAKANLGLVKINLTVGGVATAAAVSMKGGGEQVNEREGETATLLSNLSVKLRVACGGFAPRYLSRWAFPDSDSNGKLSD